MQYARKATLTVLDASHPTPTPCSQANTLARGALMNRPLRPATVIEVAQEAGVSTATAARALGNYGRVRDSTREKVLRAAEKLNYQANGLARSMITGRTKSIGVVCGDVHNPFFAGILRGITDVA